MVRSCLLRCVAFLVVLLPVTVLVAQFYVHVHSDQVYTFSIRLVYGFSVPVVQAAPAVPASPVQQAPSSAGDLSVIGGPSLSALFVNQMLASADSPAQGTGQALYDLSATYHVDDAYALATFQKESSYGKYGAGAVDHSLGNIVCAGYASCDGRFRSYPSWQTGYADFYQLIAREYIARGLVTVGEIEPVYAPSSENDTSLYIRQVCASMRAFRSLQALMG